MQKELLNLKEINIVKKEYEWNQLNGITKRYYDEYISKYVFVYLLCNYWDSIIHYN